MIDLSSTSVAYFAEGAVSAALFILLFYYFKVYRRPFLFLWSLSWAASVVSLLSLGLITLTWSGEGVLRHVFSFFATFAQTSQLIFLLLGSSALTFQAQINHKKILRWLAVSFVVAVVITVPFSFDKEFYAQRYALRLGYRYTSMLIAFLIAGYWVGVRFPVSKTVGKKLIAGSFFLFALYQLYYIAIILANSMGSKIPIPGFFGIIEVVTISLMGLSMVIYLLEDEHLRLTRSNEELANFLYRTSHDLRSPVATILSITMHAKSVLKDAESLRYMEMIEDRSKKLDTVIADILNLSRKKNAEIRYEKVDFNLLIKNIFDEISIREGPQAINLRYTPNQENVFISDISFMKASVINIIENAIKYRDKTKDRCFVSVEFRKSLDQILITISDNGQGILPECLPRIFEMFFRANADIQGTGLGLYIVADLVGKLEGKVAAASEYGQYTTITISLPNLQKS